MAKRTLSMVAAGLMLVAQSTWAYATDPIWQWDSPGTSSFYSGSQSLTDGTSSFSFSRTPNLAGSQDTVSQPPILLLAGLDIEFDIVNAETCVPKTVNGQACPSGSTFSVFAAPVTVCDDGMANNLQGIHVTAIDGGGSSGCAVTEFKPRLQVYTNGAWNYVNDTAIGSCGRLEIKKFCKN